MTQGTYEHSVEARDKDCLFVGSVGKMRTWTDKRVDPLNLQPEDICIEDIAHALSRQCRYNGHVEGFLSVARHSLWVSHFLLDFTHDRKLALWGLLHDAAETYVGDMIRPLKHRPEMELFRLADARADEAIAYKFGLCWPMPEEVKKADNHVLTNIELDDKRWAAHVSSVSQDEIQFLCAFNGLSA